MSQTPSTFQAEVDVVVAEWEAEQATRGVATGQTVAQG